MTAATVAVRLAVVAFAAIVTEPGTITAALSLERLTLTPFVGAGADMVTVQVSVPGALKALVEQESILRVVAWFSCNAKTCETPLAVAVRVADWDEVTVATVAVNVAVVALAATLTEAGTVTAVLLLDRLTLRPPVGAGADKVTVQVSLPAPLKVPVEQESALSVAA